MSRILPEKVFFIFVILAVAGCAAAGPQLQIKNVTKTHYAPTALVSTLTSPPRQPYVVIANIHASAPAGTPSAQVVAAIVKQAAALGANAIILHDLSHKSAGQMQFNPSGGLYQNTQGLLTPNFTAEAIHWIHTTIK